MSREGRVWSEKQIDLLLTHGSSCVLKFHVPNAPVFVFYLIKSIKKISSELSIKLLPPEAGSLKAFCFCLFVYITSGVIDVFVNFSDTDVYSNGWRRLKSQRVESMRSQRATIIMGFMFKRTIPWLLENGHLELSVFISPGISVSSIFILTSTTLSVNFIFR